MKRKTLADFGELHTKPGDFEHRDKYGEQVTVTKMGNVTLVHLDQPSEAVLEERIKTVLEEVISDDLGNLEDDCMMCRFTRDSFYDAVFEGDEYSVIAVKPPQWA